VDIVLKFEIANFVARKALAAKITVDAKKYKNNNQLKIKITKKYK